MSAANNSAHFNTNDIINFVSTTSGTNTFGGYHPLYIGDPPYQNQQWAPPNQLTPQPWYYDYQIQPNTITITTNTTNQQQEKPLNRSLFEIFAVNAKDDHVYGPFLIIANDADKAKMKTLVKLGADVDFDDYDFIVRNVGSVRARKEVQKVQVVKGSE